MSHLTVNVTIYEASATCLHRLWGCSYTESCLLENSQSCISQLTPRAERRAFLQILHVTYGTSWISSDRPYSLTCVSRAKFMNELMNLHEKVLSILWSSCLYQVHCERLKLLGLPLKKNSCQRLLKNKLYFFIAVWGFQKKCTKVTELSPPLPVSPIINMVH